MQVDAEVLQSIADRHGLDFVTLFGSSARGVENRDVDVAVMPNNSLDDLADREELFDDLSRAVHPRSLDLTVLPNASWLLGWQVARDGVPF